jgi:Tol biopolymer transport system component
MRRHVARLLALAALLVGVGCGSDPEAAGWELFGAGDVAGARAAFTQVQQDSGSTATGAAALGELSLLVGADSDAEAMYRTAWAAEPRNAAYTVGYGEALLRQGREDEAYEAFLQALALDANGPHVARIAGLVGDAHKVSRLTRTSTDNYSARFDLDGTHVVYTSHVDGNGELMLLTLATRQLRRLTDLPHTNEYGANYSPDGASLLYSSVQHRTNAGLITLQASGSSTRNEAFMTRDLATDEDRRLSPSPGPVGSPLYSPDGARVLFEAIVDGNLDIWTMAADGKDRLRLTTTTEDDGQAAYHPGGDRIIFVRTFERNFELMDMATDGSDTRHITTTPYAEFGGSFSADGKWFVYAVERGFATTELALMEWATRRVRPLSRVQGRCIQPAFSPDGTKVVFASDRSDYLELYMMDLTQPPNADTLRRQLNTRLRAGS